MSISHFHSFSVLSAVRKLHLNEPQGRQKNRTFSHVFVDEGKYRNVGWSEGKFLGTKINTGQLI
jgi:hypothetical protein